MSNIDDLLSGLAEGGIIEAVNKLRELRAKAKTPEERLVLAIFAGAVQKYGVKGVEEAKRAVKELLEGKRRMLPFVDIATESDALILFQKVEAGRRAEVNRFASFAADAIGAILASILRGII
jgi:hypothetical protein